MNLRQLFFLFLLPLMLGTACTALKNKPLPPAVKLPETNKSGLDTGDSLRSVKAFFSDSTLVALIDTALKSNFDLLRAIQRIEYAKANYRASKAAFLPSLNVGASAGVDKFSKNTMNGLGNFDTNLSPNLSQGLGIPDPTPDYFLGLRSSWEIGIWGKYRNYKKAGYQRLLASEKGRHLVQTSLVSEVAEYYYRLLALDAELEIITRNLTLQQTAVDKIDVLKEGARANELAVQQFNAQLLDTKSLRLMKIQEIVAAENTLNAILGRLPQLIKRGKVIKEQTLPNQLYNGIPSHLLYNRPDVKQAEAMLAAASADVNVARAAFFPSLTINSYAGYNAFDASLLFKPASVAYGAIAGLFAPVFNRYQIRSSYLRSQAERLDAFYIYQKTLVNGYQEVITNLNGIENYRNVYDLKTQEVDALRKAVSASNDLFFAGSASYLEVITARRFVLLSELEQTEAKKEELLFMVHLYRSLGGGWE